MRVLHFAHCFLPIPGGTSTRLHYLLSNGPDEHYLYVPQLPSRYALGVVKELRSREQLGNIHVRRCRLVESFLAAVPLVGTRLNARRLLRCVTDADAEIVHGHNPPAFAWAAMKYSHLYRVPLVYEIHTFHADEGVDGGEGDSWGPAKKAAVWSVRASFRMHERKVCQKANAIIVQSEMVKQRVVDVFDIPQERMRVVPMGVDGSLYDPAKWKREGQELRRRNGWEEKIVCMYNGRLDAEGGTRLLLDAARGLPPGIKQDLRLVVLGRGPLRSLVEQAERESGGCVEYVGLVDHDDMPAYYSACDMVAIPRHRSRTSDSNVPTKLLEGMAMERVILGSDVAGITQILTDGKTGLTFRAGDKDDLAEKLVYAVNNAENLRGMRSEARRAVVEEYSWSKSQVLLQSVYERALRAGDGDVT